MDRDNTEKLTLQDYEAEGLCSGCRWQIRMLIPLV